MGVNLIKVEEINMLAVPPPNWDLNQISFLSFVLHELFFRHIWFRIFYEKSNILLTKILDPASILKLRPVIVSYIFKIIMAMAYILK